MTLSSSSRKVMHSLSKPWILGTRSRSSSDWYRFLQVLIEFPDGLFFRDAVVALQPLDRSAGRSRNRVRQLRFPATRRTFDQQRFLHPSGQINRLQRYAVDDVPYAVQSLRETFD